MSASDRTAIEDLFAYTDWAWNEIAKLVESNGEADALINRAAPGSGWPTIAACLSHMNLAYERWLQDEVSGLRTAAPGEFATWARIKSHRERVREAFSARLGRFQGETLTTVRESTIDGDVLPYSPGELLTHLLLHERAHHGDFMTLLYQLGVEQIGLEYRFYLLAQRGYD